MITNYTKAPFTVIQKFLNPQLYLSGYKNFQFHTYRDSNRICPSTRMRIVLNPQNFLCSHRLGYSR